MRNGRSVAARISQWLVVVIAAAAMQGCYAEGHPFLIGKGETERFISMDACIKEAQAKYSEGGPVHSGYECRSKIATLTKRKLVFIEGKIVRGLD